VGHPIVLWYKHLDAKGKDNNLLNTHLLSIRSIQLRVSAWIYQTIFSLQWHIYMQENSVTRVN